MKLQQSTNAVWDNATSTANPTYIGTKSDVRLMYTDNTNPYWIWIPPYNDQEWKWNDLNPYNPYPNRTVPHTTTNLKITTTKEPTGYVMKKVAIFTVERDDKGKIKSAKFVDEMWIPSDVDASLYVAKKLTKENKEFDEKNTIIKEVSHVTL